MIITAADIRTVRPIAANVSDSDRINTYIAEAESLFVMPSLGAAMYKAIDTTPASYATLLAGGYYDSDTKHFHGLTYAIAYLSYSRFIRNQSINTTAFGVTVKRGDFSDPVDDRTIVRAANEAEKIGLEYLNQCVEYLRFTEVVDSCQRVVTRRKFKAIG